MGMNKSQEFWTKRFRERMEYVTGGILYKQVFVDPCIVTKYGNGKSWATAYPSLVTALVCEQMQGSDLVAENKSITFNCQFSSVDKEPVHIDDDWKTDSEHPIIIEGGVR